MFLKKNIHKIQDCYGCGVCSLVCPKKIISIRLNNDGFYEPEISDESQCIECGLCLSVCAFNHKELCSANTRPLTSYAAWSNEYAVLRKCSSGGIGYEIGRQLIRQGYKVCAVRYDSDLERAEHFVAGDEMHLMESIGSKYIQSYTLPGLSMLSRGEKYLVTGTPCQIDSFRRYIRHTKQEDNFILLDFFCHGIPSLLAWRKYLHQVEKVTGKTVSASWRNKHTGWHDSWNVGVDGVNSKNEMDWHESYSIKIREKKSLYQSRWTRGDVFYKLFLGDYCSNIACEKNCKYKYDRSSADIRIGDLWGDTYKNNEDGVSAVVAFTPKGKYLIESLQNCTLIEHPFDVVAEGQMKENIGHAFVSPIIRVLLRSRFSVPFVAYKILFLIEKVLRLLFTHIKTKNRLLLII